MLRSLDLFTGIAGNVLAFENFARPVGYCEISPSRVALLKHLMQSKKIPEAPLHDDIRTFTYSGSEEIDLVCGSWPCRGFAVCGPKNGFEHPHSALFDPFAEVILQVKPKFIFQENVPGVCLGSTLETICAKVGKEYDLWWTVAPAYIVGAQHIRQRWYCFGVRKDIRNFTLRQTHTYTPFSWASEVCPRMVLDCPKNTINRLSMLGNAVVPECVRTLFLYLFTGCRHPLEDLRAMTTFELHRPEVTKELPKDGKKRRWGACIQGTLYTVPPPSHHRCRRPDLGLVLNPGSFVTVKTPKAKPEDILRDVVPLKMWATPRGGALGSTQVLTRRSAADVCTQIRFEQSTPDNIRQGHVNPCFVEWLMGFPQNWTLY